MRPTRAAKLVDYDFDTIPTSVLKQWRSVKAEGFFQAFEIWTPERKAVDPILVGYVAKESKRVKRFVRAIGPFLIARWGEALASFAEITKLVEQRDHDERAAHLDLLRYMKEEAERYRPAARWVTPRVNDGSFYPITRGNTATNIVWRTQPIDGFTANNAE